MVAIYYLFGCRKSYKMY